MIDDVSPALLRGNAAVMYEVTPFNVTPWMYAHEDLEDEDERVAADEMIVLDASVLLRLDELLNNLRDVTEEAHNLLDDLNESPLKRLRTQ
jgi:hypothetical protein